MIRYGRERKKVVSPPLEKDRDVRKWWSVRLQLISLKRLGTSPRKVKTMKPSTMKDVM